MVRSGSPASAPLSPAGSHGAGPALAARTFTAALARDHAGRWDEAAQLYESVLAINSGHLGALHNLGYLRLRQGRRDEAERLLRKTVRLHPRSADAHNSLGLVLHTAGRFREAIACFRRAVSLNPANAMAHNNLGAALHESQRPEEALVCYRKALSCNPQYPDALRNMGNALQSIGRIGEARRAYQAALSLAPRQATLYHSLSACWRFTAGDPYLAAMEALAADADGLGESEAMHLHFALAKALRDTGGHRRAFDHLVRANALKRRQVTYDEAGSLAQFAGIRAAFSPERMRAVSDGTAAAAGPQSPVPIFVIGMMRSGTTLTEQILSSHTEITGGGELPVLRQSVEAVLDGRPWPDACASLPPARLAQIGARYRADLRRDFPGARYVVDKMPTNFLYAGVIALALPGARIVHMRRDPVDTCISCFSLLFKGDLPFTYDLAEVGRYYRAYEGLMEHWRRVLPPGLMLEIAYENLVGDLEGSARRLLAHCGLEWNAACLNYDKTERVVLTASAAQVRQPIYRTSIGRWRPYGDLLQPLFDALGRRFEGTGG